MPIKEHLGTIISQEGYLSTNFHFMLYTDSFPKILISQTTIFHGLILACGTSWSTASIILHYWPWILWSCNSLLSYCKELHFYFYRSEFELIDLNRATKLRYHAHVSLVEIPCSHFIGWDTILTFHWLRYHAHVSLVEIPCSRFIGWNPMTKGGTQLWR